LRAYFEILFEVNVTHRFYSPDDEFRCKALLFEPTAACSQLLREHKLYFRPTVNGFIIAAEKKMTGAGTEAVPVLTPVMDIEPGTCFNFLIRSNRRDFLNITDADLTKFEGGRKLFLRNDLNSPLATTIEVQAPEMNNFLLMPNPLVTTVTVHSLGPLTRTLKLGPSGFVAPVKLADNPVKVILRDADGNLVVQKNVPRNSAGDIIVDRILLADTPLQENIYLLQQVDATGVIVSDETWFLSSQSGSGDIEGIFQLQYNHALINTAANQYRFEVDLEARSVQWTYKIQVDQYDPPNVLESYDPNDLRLNTTTNNVPVLGTSFNQSNVPGPPIVVTFDSLAQVPLQEEPYVGINLRDNNVIGTDENIISNLPNPNPMMLSDAGGGNYKIEMFLKIK
jgi:hypothetical protein